VKDQKEPDERTNNGKLNKKYEAIKKKFESNLTDLEINRQKADKLKRLKEELLAKSVSFGDIDVGTKIRKMRDTVMSKVAI
jgi:hypothetical protein